jgi:hypothetical protein
MLSGSRKVIIASAVYGGRLDPGVRDSRIVEVRSPGVEVAAPGDQELQVI